MMNVPTLQQARLFLADAAAANPGPWVQHCVFVAQVAEAIATYHPRLDAATAWVLGYLHDIGRGAGVSDMRHILDGYTFLHSRGFDEAARICLTHSYPIKDARAFAGDWDGSDEEFAFVCEQLAGIEYNDYDRLIQLCDALATANGPCLLEKRLLDVSLRRGTNEWTIHRWHAFLQLKRCFDEAIDRNIYTILPGVVEGTFGFDPQHSADGLPAHQRHPVSHARNG